MTNEQIALRLTQVGASQAEASDLAEIMYINGWFEIRAVKPSEKVLDDCGTWLEDWRKDRREVAQAVRDGRQRRIDAGYRSDPVSAPVNLGGRAEW